MTYIIKWMPETLQDVIELKRNGNKIVIAKIEKLLLELAEHPTTGTGQVEALKGNLSGYWSWRIDKFNRLIYRIQNETVTVIVVAAKGHYGRK